MKKIIRPTAYIMATILLCLNISISAFASGLTTAGIYDVTKRVYVSGQLDSGLAGALVSLLLIHKDTDPDNMIPEHLGHIEQTIVADNGEYGFKFKFTGNIDDYTVRINQAGTNVTASVTKAVAVNELLKVDLDLGRSGSLAKAIVNINNLYKINSLTYTMALAFYSRDGKILDIKIANNKAVGDDQTFDEIENNTPAGCKKIKAFIWDSAEKMIPLSKFAENEDDDHIKILAIGNSFSEDATSYVRDFALADNVNMTIVNLYIPSCSLQMHWENASADAKAYAYQLNGAAASKTVSIRDVLLEDEWDYVTLQQRSGDSGNGLTYYPYIEDLAKYVKTLEPMTELLIHQTWAYEKGFTQNQTLMFDSLKIAYDDAAERVGLLKLDNGTDVSLNNVPLRILPSGKAMQNARGHAIFDTTYEDGKSVRLIRDGYHASLYHGRYLLGAVWYEALTNKNVAENTFRPSNISDQELSILKESAHNAVVEYGWRN